MTTKRNPLVRDKSEEGNPLTQSLKKLCLDARSSSMQSIDQMEVEGKPSPQNVPEERRSHTPQPQQESQPVTMENGQNIVISTDPSSPLNRKTPSPVPPTIMVPASPHKSPDGATEMKQYVIITENHRCPVSKSHLMPPSPAHTPQPLPQSTTDTDRAVRALIYHERGEPVQDPIMQFVPNQVREESPIKKGESSLITCGNSKAELYWKKFICPGINAKCVKCRGVWLTPKEFVQEAGKSTLKDWKRAIRINGTMLRKLIENGEVCYYQHDTNCSNQCRSNKSLESSTSQGSFNHSFETTDSKDNFATEDATMEQSITEENTGFLKTREVFQRDLYLKRNAWSFEHSSSEDSGLAPAPPLDGAAIMRESIASSEKVQDLQTFWMGIIRIGLFDEVIQDIISQVTAAQHRAKTLPVIPAEDAVTMTNLANTLELIQTIAEKTATHKMTVERQAEQSKHLIQDLERKIAEEKRFESDLKRKSQHLDSVMKLTPDEKRKRPTIMRLYRQKAVESRITPAVLQQQSTSAQSSSTRLPPPESMVGVHTNPLMRYTGSEIWVPQSSSAVAHALQVASNPMAQIGVTRGMVGIIPPHLLTAHPDPSTFQVHQDLTKK